MDRYKVKRFIDGRLDDTEMFTGCPLAWLQAYLKEAVDEKVADSGEIFDEAGNLLFQWPPPASKEE